MTTAEAKKLMNKGVILYYKGSTRMVMGTVLEVMPRNIRLDMGGISDWIYLPDIRRYQVISQPA